MKVNYNLLLMNEPVRLVEKGGIDEYEKNVINVFSPSLREINILGDDYLDLCSCILSSRVTERDLEKFQGMDCFDKFTLQILKIWGEKAYEALRLFTKVDYEYVEEKLEYGTLRALVGGDGSYLNKNNFLSFIEAVKNSIGLKIEFGIEEEEVKKLTPFEKMVEENKRWTEEALAKQGKTMKESQCNDINVIDWITIYCSFEQSSYNLSNIWDINIVMFMTEFERVKILRKYEEDCRSLMAGADKDNIDLKHYFCKLD